MIDQLVEKIPSNLIPSDPRFGCGPSLIPTEHVKALLDTGAHLLGTSHRKPAIKNLVKELQQNLKKYFDLPEGYEVVLGNGGATCMFDAIALGLVKKSIAHFICGEFSEKWYLASSKVPWIKAIKEQVPYAQGIEMKDVAGVDAICGTLCETSTGVQLLGVPDVDPREDKLICVDATSSAGQVPCDIKKVDVYFFAPQKVFASEGGLWVAFLSPKAIARTQEVAAIPGRYIPEFMNLTYAIENAKGNQTYTTPSISTIFFFNEQLKRMLPKGRLEVEAMAAKKAKLLYGWAEEKPYLSCYIQEAKYRSVAVACIDVDPKADVAKIISALSDKKIVYGIDPYRKLGRNQFRIALFDAIKFEDLEKLTKILSFLIEGLL